jgi:hypothetical protein
MVHYFESSSLAAFDFACYFLYHSRASLELQQNSGGIDPFVIGRHFLGDPHVVCWWCCIDPSLLHANSDQIEIVVAGSDQTAVGVAFVFVAGMLFVLDVGVVLGWCVPMFCHAERLCLDLFAACGMEVGNSI